MSSPELPQGPQLTVDFCGEAHELAPGDDLDFGRAAHLEIDDNPYMHRIVGRFSFRGGVWWLHNVGASIPLTVVNTETRAYAYVTPESQAALTLTQGVVQFEAGPTEYELELLVEETTATANQADEPSGSGSETITIAELPLTRSQRRILLALAEPVLTDSRISKTLVPTNRAAANRLGLRMPQFNRGLDRLCTKLTRQGVTGLGGDSANLAVDRRERLVEWAVTNGVVTISDLPLLDPSAEETSAKNS